MSNDTEMWTWAELLTWAGRNSVSLISIGPGEWRAEGNPGPQAIAEFKKRRPIGYLPMGYLFGDSQDADSRTDQAMAAIRAELATAVQQRLDAERERDRSVASADACQLELTGYLRSDPVIKQAAMSRELEAVRGLLTAEASARAQCSAWAIKWECSSYEQQRKALALADRCDVLTEQVAIERRVQAELRDDLAAARAACDATNRVDSAARTELAMLRNEVGALAERLVDYAASANEMSSTEIERVRADVRLDGARRLREILGGHAL
jgi:hypothetical protein